MRKITYAKAISEAIAEEMERDGSVFLMGEDVANGTFMNSPELQKYVPDRVIDSPLAENLIATFGIGAAMSGMRPVLDFMFADLMTLAFEPIVNVAAKERYMSGGNTKIPVVFKAGHGVGLQIGSVHSQSVESWFMNVPGLKIVVPSTPYDVKGLLKTAIRDDDPVVFLEARMAYYRVKGEVPEEEYTIPFGLARVAREGTDVTIVAWQKSYHDSMAAAEELLIEEGISVEIIDPRTLVPLDKSTIIDSIKKTGRAIIAHEAPKRGGAGGEISAIISEEAAHYLKAPIMRVAGANVPIPFGVTELELVPDKEDIKKAVIEIMKKDIKSHLRTI